MQLEADAALTELAELDWDVSPMPDVPLAWFLEMDDSPPPRRGVATNEEPPPRLSAREL